MKLVNIADEGAKYKWQLYDLYDKAFPEQEKKPLQVMENLVADGKMEMLAMVDEDEFVGLAAGRCLSVWPDAAGIRKKESLLWKFFLEQSSIFPPT